jgi:arsenate reductase-like glutaredoxin family protein
LQKGAELEERDFFKERFSEEEIRELASLAGGLSEMFAWRSPSLKKMGLAGQELSQGQMLLDLMLQEPRLVRRPLIKIGDRLLVGGSVKAIEEALPG